MFLAELTLQALRWLPMAVVAAAIAAVGTWWLYRPQLRRQTRLVRWGLPGLRCLAPLSLAVALIKPAVLRPKSEAERGTIVVLVDQSASMNVTDTGRSAAQLIALADGLKLLPPAATAALRPQITQNDVELLRSLGDRISRAASELDYARLADRGVEAAQARLDEAITELTNQAQTFAARIKTDPKPGRMATRMAGLLAPAPADREAWVRELPTRIERVAAVANESETGVAEQMYRGSADVRAACDRVAKLPRLELAKLTVRQALADTVSSMEIYGFASSVVPLTLDRAASAEATAVPAGRSTAAGVGGSDLTGALRDVLQRHKPGQVRAIVLLSDGRQVGGETTVETIATIAGEAKIYGVRMAPRVAPRDVSINRIVLPGRGFVGETLNVRVDVRAYHVRGDVPVECTIGPATQTKTVRIAEEGMVSVEFSAKLEQAGPLRVSATAAAQAGEITTENNTSQRWVSVLSDKVRVTMVAQSAGRDFQFLRDALSRTPWVKLEESIAPSPEAAAAVKDGSLRDADVVVLEDAGPSLLSAEQWRLVRSGVAERGAGVILLAGEVHAPGELLAQPDAAELLPIAKEAAAAWRTWAGEWPSLRAVPARTPGDRGKLPDVLRLTDDPESSLRLWEELPAMFRLMNLAPLKPNASPLLVDAETKSPVVTDSRLGAGRVLFVGMNETWRWRYKTGQRDQDRFWLQMVRQVSDEPYAATAGGVSIDADRVATDVGRPLRLRARVRGASGKASADAAMQITVKAADGQTRVETLPATPLGSGRYAKVVNNWPPGEYQLSTAGAAGPSMTVRITAGSEAELANMSGDEKLLRRLADATGGQSLGPEQLADLPAQLAAQAAQHPQIAEVRLWDSPYLFAFVLACLGLEWAVRKHAGLV